MWPRRAAVVPDRRPRALFAQPVAAILLDTIADAAAAEAVGRCQAGSSWPPEAGTPYMAVSLAITVVVACHAADMIRKIIGRLRAPPASAARGSPGHLAAPAGHLRFH